MQIGSEMATLQEKTPKMDPKKRFFLKNPPGFLAFEKSSSKLTSNRPFWLKQIYRDIKFVLKRLPGRCGPNLQVRENRKNHMFPIASEAAMALTKRSRRDTSRIVFENNSYLLYSIFESSSFVL